MLMISVAIWFSDDIEATSDDDLDVPGPEGKKLPLPMKKLEAFYTMRMMKSAQHKLQVCLVLSFVDRWLSCSLVRVPAAAVPDCIIALF